MKKVCVVSGTRAEYGILQPLLDRIKNDKKIELQLLITGMHLSPEFGLTYKEIEKDGYKINEKIEILLSSDTPNGICKSIGLGMISFSEAFNRLKPDLIVILGDRYELLSLAGTAVVHRIPIAHIHGGEQTFGATDEAIRHSMTKMSYLHFTSAEEYKKRVIQLGENPNRVFNVGALGIENINKIELMTKEELEESIKFEFGKKIILVTFHPVTLEKETSKEQFQNVLDAIEEFDDLKIIFTKTNSDTDGRIINEMIDEYVSKNQYKSIAFTSMGQLRYLSAMKCVDAIVGNSSSGIIEAPSFKVPTVNVGDRQKGRIRCKSIIDCQPQVDEIAFSLKKAFSDEFVKSLDNMENPYGDGNVSAKILSIIKEFLYDNKIDIKKVFYDVEFEIDKGMN